MQYQAVVRPLIFRNYVSKVLLQNSQDIGTYHCQRHGILSITNAVVYWKIPLCLAPTACLKMVALCPFLEITGCKEEGRLR